jgi:hypothetical protein
MHSFWLVSTLGGLVGGLDGGRVGSLVGPVVHLFPFPDIDVVGRRCRVALTYYLYRMQCLFLARIDSIFFYPRASYSVPYHPMPEWRGCCWLY